MRKVKIEANQVSFHRFFGTHSLSSYHTYLGLTGITHDGLTTSTTERL